MQAPRVQLMATCLADAFFDDVARATVEVLEHLGCEVSFPEDQTCCSQPAFNSGDSPAARSVARHCLRVFNDAAPFVPSTSRSPISCCAYASAASALGQNRRAPRRR